MTDMTRHGTAPQAILLWLAYATQGMQVSPAAKLFDMPPGEVEEALESLHGEGTALEEGGVWRLNGPLEDYRQPLREAAAAVMSASDGRQCGNVLRGLVHCVMGERFDGVRLLLEQSKANAFNAVTAANLCLEIILGAMEVEPLGGLDEEDRRRHVLLAIEITHVAAYFVTQPSVVCPLLDRTAASAMAHGDRRSVAILSILKAHMQAFSSFNLSPGIDQLFQAGFEMGQSFGDEDMREYMATFLGFRHFLKGQFPETVHYLGSVPQGFTMPHGLFWWELFLGMSLAFVGLDRQAIGVMDSNWRTSELHGDRLSAAVLRLHLALVLMMSGKLKEALSHLDVLSDSIGNDSLPFLNMRLSWIFVYYHFLAGNLPASHAMLERCEQVILDRNLGHPTYHFPWMLRVLYAFRKAGLPDVRVFAFDSELEMALHSPSLQLQASAWLVKGNMLLDDEGRQEEARTAYKRALKLFLSIGNPVEAARVKLELARACMLSGRRIAAMRLRDGAYAVHLAYSKPNWPSDLPRPRTVRSHFSCTRAPFGRKDVRNAVELPLKSQEDVAQRLITNLCNSLRVERGALFSVSSGDLVPLGRFNLSLIQYDSQAFARCRSWLRKECDSVQITRRSGPDGYAVCIPISCGGRQLLIYLCNIYFTRELESLDNATLRSTAESFCENLRLSGRLSPLVDENMGAGGDLVIMPQADPGALLTRSRAMLPLLQKLKQIAATDAPVLIFGETGVGKELLAKQLHKNSGRRGPFVSVHPASMTETLFESAFFGHEKGAFTGATSQKIGFFELANHGTLFIDEVGEMPLSMQTKFLRVLQERAFIRVGGLREIHSDFRLVTATNRDLEKEVAAGNFRQDLYYRLSVVPMQVPPLRMRDNDAILLAQHFLSVYMRKYQRPNLSLSRSDLIKIVGYPWPGNVRELENVIERAVILAGDGQLDLSLSAPVSEDAQTHAAPSETGPGPQLIGDWPTLGELERRYIKLVLEQTGGRIYGDNGAESILGIGRSTLYAKIRRYGFKARRYYS